MVACLLSACGGDVALGDYPASTCDLTPPPAEVARDTPLAVATFWAADEKESAAFKLLADRADDTGYVVSTERMRTRVDTQRHISDAFVSKRLPDVFQVNGGSDVLRWVEGADAESTDVCALDALRDRYGWKLDYFPEALAPLSCQGRLFGLPVGIHHLNVLFYNEALFAKLVELAHSHGLELTAPADLKDPHELVSLLESVIALDPSVVPLSIGSDSDWPLTIVAFENVLLGLGQHAYERVWMGGLQGDDGTRRAELETTLSDMLEVLQRLMDLSNFSERATWQDAVRQVGDGKALFTITGDWGYAQLDEDTFADVRTVTFPGTAGSFVYTPDSFAVPRELGKNGSAAHGFLHSVVENKQALTAFSNAKHSIPPRLDLNDEEIAGLASENLRATYRQFVSCSLGIGDCSLLLAVSGLGPSPGADPCLDEVDALLTLAAAGASPSAKFFKARRCSEAFPTAQEDAKRRLLELLLGVGERRFVASCR